VGTNRTGDGHTRHPDPPLFEEAQPGILGAAAQYGVRERILDLCTFDITRNPWRCGALFDAIVTDPPCKLPYLQNRCEHNNYQPKSDSSFLDGVRAGAKRLGRKKERVADLPHPAQPRQYVFGRAIPCSSVTPQALFFLNLARDDDRPYVPPTKPYELSALATDLVVLARYLLKPGGRLVFFLPTVVDEYKELDLDSLLCDGMQVIANSLQDFGAWGRRVRCRRHSRSARWYTHYFSSAHHDPQGHVSTVPSADIRIARRCAA
jgi:tRNA (guanine10-N2)-methyltransferase